MLEWALLCSFGMKPNNANVDVEKSGHQLQCRPTIAKMRWEERIKKSCSTLLLLREMS